MLESSARNSKNVSKIRKTNKLLYIPHKKLIFKKSNRHKPFILTEHFPAKPNPAKLHTELRIQTEPFSRSPPRLVPTQPIAGKMGGAWVFIYRSAEAARYKWKFRAVGRSVEQPPYCARDQCRLVQCSQSVQSLSSRHSSLMRVHSRFVAALALVALANAVNVLPKRKKG